MKVAALWRMLLLIMLFTNAGDCYADATAGSSFRPVSTTTSRIKPFCPRADRAELTED